MWLYTRDHDGRFPSPSKWCDLLPDTIRINQGTFQCPGIRPRADRYKYPLELDLYSRWRFAQRFGGLDADYAMNPYVEGVSANEDTVLLFETRPGWNQTGGPEILTMASHGGGGCNVLFKAGNVEFVKTEDLGKLRWKPD